MFLLFLLATVAIYIIGFAATLWLIVKARQWYNGQYARPVHEASRQWFQFHLSTCLMIMIVASILIWFNVYQWHFFGPFYGFPLPYYDCPTGWNIAWFGGSSYREPVAWRFHLDSLILDILIGLAVCFFTGVFFEWIARKKIQWF